MLTITLSQDDLQKLAVKYLDLGDRTLRSKSDTDKAYYDGAQMRMAMLLMDLGIWNSITQYFQPENRS